MNKLRIYSTLTAALLGLVSATSVALDQSFDNLTPKRFLYAGTFGLELTPSSPSKTHGIVTYLPPGSLLFYHPTQCTNDHSTQCTKKIGSKNYRAVVTQFGQQLWVRDSEVSNVKIFNEVYGKGQNVIFNQDGFMCSEEDKLCDKLSNEAIEINRGDVLGMKTNSNGNDFYHLRSEKKYGNSLKKIVQEGYLSAERFKEFERLGVLTNASNQHPAALHLDTIKLSKLATQCGERLLKVNKDELSNELETKAGISFIDWLTMAFRNKRTHIESKTIKLEYGGIDIATERTILKIKRPVSDGNFSSQDEQTFQPLYLALEIKCIGPQNDQEAVHIHSVTVRNKHGNYLGIIKSANFYDIPEDAETPSDEALSNVYRRNGLRPFLVSITSREDYKKAIVVLMENLEIDVSLANILLSELNASCNTRYEGKQTKRKICQNSLPSLRLIDATEN